MEQIDVERQLHPSVIMFRSLFNVSCAASSLPFCLLNRRIKAKLASLRATSGLETSFGFVADLVQKAAMEGF